MLNILRNKDVWFTDASQLKWTEFKSHLFDSHGVVKLRFFHTLREVRLALSSCSESELPDILVLEFCDESQEVVVSELSKRFTELCIVVQFNDLGPNLKESLSLLKAGTRDIISWESVKSPSFIAKLEHLSQGKNKESKVDFSSGVKLDGVWIKNLTSKQIQFVGLFLDAPQRTITRDLILQGIWEGVKVHPKVVDVHLYNLRRKLGPFGFIIKSKGGGAWTLASNLIGKEFNA